MSGKIIGIIIGISILIAGGIIYAAIQSGNGGEINNQTENSGEMNGELKIEDVKVGEGAIAENGKKVTVHYVGTFPDGKKFDSSRDRGEPFTFTLGARQVIQGWDQGVLGMKEGGLRKLSVPPELGYGMNDYGPIPGGSTLLFEVELLKVE
jgi:FKBP-type peptidyl-prolyl cis-trans isomerase